MGNLKTKGSHTELLAVHYSLSGVGNLKTKGSHTQYGVIYSTLKIKEADENN